MKIETRANVRDISKPTVTLPRFLKINYEKHKYCFREPEWLSNGYTKLVPVVDADVVYLVRIEELEAHDIEATGLQQTGKSNTLSLALLSAYRDERATNNFSVELTTINVDEMTFNALKLVPRPYYEYAKRVSTPAQLRNLRGVKVEDEIDESETISDGTMLEPVPSTTGSRLLL
jgi:hypothetical protein